MGLYVVSSLAGLGLGGLLAVEVEAVVEAEVETMRTAEERPKHDEHRRAVGA